MKKGTLRSFSYGANAFGKEIPQEVWALFLDAVNDDCSVRTFDYAYDIITAAMNKRIALDREFSLFGYIYRMQEMGERKKRARAKKFRSIVTLSDINNEVASFGNSVSEETVSTSGSLADKLVNEYELLVDSEELKFAVASVIDMNEHFMLEEGVDLIKLLKSAVNGLPTAQKRLSEICSCYEVVADYIKVILSSGTPVVELFA